MRKENVVNKNKCFPGRFLSGVFRLYCRLVNKETTLLYQQRISGRSRIKCKMTPLFDNGGFTLIELLVVVLIIGILAGEYIQYPFAKNPGDYCTKLQRATLKETRATHRYFVLP